MKKIICTILFLMMVFGTMTAPAWAESDSVDRILSSMSLRDKVAQMMIASFRVWEEVPAENGDKPEGEPVKENITALNDPIREMAGRNHFGGMLLFLENCVEAEQTLRLISDIQEANRAGGGGVMRDLPADGSTRSTNLPAELLACFGVGDTHGKLPVNIPDLDENFQPTDKILWSRGEPVRQ